MKCQILFSRKNKKNIPKCRLLKFLPRMQSVKAYFHNINIAALTLKSYFTVVIK